MHQLFRPAHEHFALLEWARCVIERAKIQVPGAQLPHWHAATLMPDPKLNSGSCPTLHLSGLAPITQPYLVVSHPHSSHKRYSSVPPRLQQRQSRLFGTGWENVNTLTLIMT